MSEHQIVAILKEAEAGILVKELCRNMAWAIQLSINSVINTMV
jgi:hypothetical protein